MTESVPGGINWVAEAAKLAKRKRDGRRQVALQCGREWVEGEGLDGSACRFKGSQRKPETKRTNKNQRINKRAGMRQLPNGKDEVS